MSLIKNKLLEAKALLKQEKEKRLAAGVNGKPITVDKGAYAPEAKKHLARWGVKSFDELAVVNTADSKYSYMSKEDKEKVKSFKEHIDVAVMCSKIFKVPVKETKAYQDLLSFDMKAFGIAGGDDGFEWIPTMVAESYIDEFNLDRKVSGMFAEIKMPSNPYKFPVLSNGSIARRVGAITALSPAQAFKTDKTILFDAVKLTNQYELPEELNEDSAVDMIKAIRQELIEGQEKALEIAILEGDADGTHQHHFSQLPDVVAGTTIASILAETPEAVFDGLRKRALGAGAAGTVDAGGNSITEAELSQARGKLGKFGVDPKGLAWIPSPKTYNQMLQLDDVRTLEQYGQQATVLSGELAKYEGAPVVPSEWLREDCAATGVNTVGGPNDTGSIILVNRKRFFVGMRRGIQVLVEKNRTQYDVLDMVSFCRKAFQGVLKPDASNYASESSVALVFNIGL